MTGKQGAWTMRPDHVSCQFLVCIAEPCLAVAKEASELKDKCELIDIADALVGKVREVAEAHKALNFPRRAVPTSRVSFMRHPIGRAHVAERAWD